MPYKDPEKAREASRKSAIKYREKNREKIRITAIGRYHAYKKHDTEEKLKAAIRRKEWGEKNKERVRTLQSTPDQIQKSRERAKKWQRENRGKARANNRLRKMHVRRAMPKWVPLKDIQVFYEMASDLEKKTGQKYHIDHIVPLINETVCGLHVPWNLRVIPAEENLKKGNKF
jgi:hypothetical protein